MYPRPFEYQRVNSVQEAIQALQGNEDAKIIAGGHSLLPVMKLRLASPSLLVDISKVAELKNVSLNGGATIGAGVTYNELLGNDQIKASYPVLHEAVARSAMSRSATAARSVEQPPTPIRLPTSRPHSWPSEPNSPLSDRTASARSPPTTSSSTC